jgi:hypothetical protein
MPTYVCSVLENSVDDRQKEAIAEAISRIHSEETPRAHDFTGVPNQFSVTPAYPRLYVTTESPPRSRLLWSETLRAFRAA